jgi:hypothetical protein
VPGCDDLAVGLDEHGFGLIHQVAGEIERDRRRTRAANVASSVPAAVTRAIAKSPSLAPVGDDDPSERIFGDATLSMGR